MAYHMEKLEGICKGAGRGKRGYMITLEEPFRSLRQQEELPSGIFGPITLLPTETDP
jgi:hypothetical protein